MKWLAGRWLNVNAAPTPDGYAACAIAFPFVTFADDSLLGVAEDGGVLGMQRGELTLHPSGALYDYWLEAVLDARHALYVDREKRGLSPAEVAS